jgi:transposase-like protein
MGHGPASEFQFEFKRQLAKEFLDGRAGLHELARPHSLSRNLIRPWIRKYEAGEFSDDLAEAAPLPSTNDVTCQR